MLSPNFEVQQITHTLHLTHPRPTHASHHVTFLFNTAIV